MLGVTDPSDIGNIHAGIGARRLHDRQGRATGGIPEPDRPVETAAGDDIARVVATDAGNPGGVAA